MTKIKISFVLIVANIFLVGCDARINNTSINKCVQLELYNKCIATFIDNTVHIGRDVEEINKSCYATSLDLSVRKMTTIPEACRTY